MLQSVATSLNITRFFGKVPASILTKPAQATGPLVAPMTIAAKDAAAPVNTINNDDSNTSVTNNSSAATTGQTNDAVLTSTTVPSSADADGSGTIIKLMQRNSTEQGNQVTSEVPWILSKDLGTLVRGLEDPETNIPLFREFDFA